MASDDYPEDLRSMVTSLEARLTILERHFGIPARPAIEPATVTAPETAPSEMPGPAAAPATTPPADPAQPMTALPPNETGGEGAVPRAAAAQAAQQNTFETMIGAHWLNRIGIAALMMGVAFFLKYAFDNQWIGPAWRVMIGIGLGIALLILSERFQARGHSTFSHSIKVVGAGVLYLSIWAASQVYSLIGSGTALTAMTVVTAAIVGLSILRQSEFLASVALLCGFMTPVLLSTPENRQIELFAYLALLDAAALILAALFPWARSIAVAFFGTHILYLSWYTNHFSREQLGTTIAFAALFFVLFAVVPLLRRWERGGVAGAVVLLLPFCNAAMYFFELAAMIHAEEHRLARHAVILAGFFLALAAALRFQGRRDDLAAAHLVIGIGFLTVAIPLRFDALWITIGWLVEAAVLLALTRRFTGPARRVFRGLGSWSLATGVFRLLFVDDFKPAMPLWNQRMMVYGLAAAIFVVIALAQRTRGPLWKFAVIALNVLLLIAFTLEVSDYYNRLGGSEFASRSLARDFAWSALWMGYGVMLMTVGFRRRTSFVRWLALALLGITVAKVFLYDLSALQRVYRILSFIVLGVILLTISYAYQKKWIAPPVDHAEDGGLT